MKVIQNIHGVHGGMGSNSINPKGGRVWASMVRLSNKVNDMKVIPFSFIRKRVGNGGTTKFWNDVWLGEDTLAMRFPKFYALDLNKDCCVTVKWWVGGGIFLASSFS